MIRFLRLWWMVLFRCLIVRVLCLLSILWVRVIFGV